MGRYHLVERLAVGGMAEVFLACERGGEHSLDRLVVIKRILPHLAEKPHFVDMFLHEARIAARINHPNVVEIHELGESGGFPFIAMEYVAGSTLKQLVRAAGQAGILLPVDAVIHLLLQACAGAHAAHELTDAQGRPYHLVHRDLTPHNLMVTDQAHVKLLDFGIAKAAFGAEATRTGMLKGKISYMSPEQCRQETLDRRSDVFALGIVAWELLAGRKPFAGRSELATMQAIVTGDLPHLRQARPDVPEPVAAAIHRALALSPDQRYDTADAMRRELRDVARLSDLHLDEDRTGQLVRQLLGRAHEARRTQVDTALERTLLSLSAVEPAPLSTTLPAVTGSQAPTRTVAPQQLAALSVGLLLFAGIGSALALGLIVAVYAAVSSGPRLVGDPLVVAVAPTLDPEVLADEHEPIRLYLERSLKRPVHLAIASSYEAAADRVLDGEVPYALLPDGVLERALSENPDLDLLAVKVVDGSTTTDGYLVVPRTSDARSLEDLRDQVVCYPDRDSRTGHVLPRKLMREQGFDPDGDFGSHISGNHDQVLRDLIAGVCAAGGTFSGNYNTADQRGIPTARLRILQITGTTPHDAVVAGPAAEPEPTAALRRALLAFDPQRDAGVPRVGDSERITGFAPPPVIRPEPDEAQPDPETVR